MKKLNLDIKNCYGIRSMRATLHFESGNNTAIYASNGTMKSSLAHVFKDARDRNNSKNRDRIFTDEISSHEILSDGEKIDPKAIMVFDPADALDETQASAGILVKKDLSEEYGALMEGLKKGMTHLVARLNELSGITKSNIPDTILKDFCHIDYHEGEIYELLLDHVGHDPSESERFRVIKYAHAFNDDTKRVFDTADFQRLLGKYIERHDRLVESSRFLSGRFDHHAATSIQKSLQKSGFFDANHMVVLNPKQGRKDAAEEIRDPQKLDDLVKDELRTIEKELDKDWDEMDALLARTAKLADFRQLLAANRWLIPRLAHPGSLKRDLWTSYFAAENSAVAALCEQYRQDRHRLGEIVDEARSEETEWRSIVAEFKRRFRAPFELDVTNQAEAVLGTEVPALQFTYSEEASGDDGRVRKKEVKRDQLGIVLSDGERRALYILNMLFEVKKQIGTGRETVVVLDDLVDSFDYENKYAIVHYLKEVLSHANFHMIILTHNFDFLRTIIKRGIVSRKQVCFVDKKANKTTLTPSNIPDNPLAAFIDRPQDPANLIASIPFARNIIEYTSGTTNDGDYLELTRLLHWREGTDKATVDTLLKIIDTTFHRPKTCSRPTDIGRRTIFNMIISEANTCSLGHKKIGLEEKIVLSIAIRLLAERLLVDKLLDGRAPPVKKRINIHAWIAEHKQTLETKAARDGRPLAEQEIRELEVLDDVALMTPEAIHINSFMYEPILDMSGQHLADLYRKVRRLEKGGGA